MVQLFTGTIKIPDEDGVYHDMPVIKGGTGATGATGATGPNTVSTTTATNIAGLLKGNGTIVSAATADTDYLTPGTAATTYEPQKGSDDNYVTDAEKAVIGNTSGTNTGDETASTIKTKLGVTTLSGSNTGDQDLSGLAAVTSVTTNSDAVPALGTIVNNVEYRCTNTSPTTAPTMTLAAIAGTMTEFICAVIFKAPNSTAPVITNNSGYTLKYSGQDVSGGIWVPVAGTVYRMSIVFDGIYVNIYVSGVSA